MAKAPAVVIIVRHGARLDAADKSWHLSSPTPYDPPLTYGGWVQSRALGLRIASLLAEREKDAASSGPTSPASVNPQDSGLGIRDFALADSAAKPQTKSKARKHKVVVHSSPFQRCVQTGIGISAGLSQYQGLSTSGGKNSDTRGKSLGQLRNSPRLRPTDSTKSPKLRPVLEVHPESPEAFRSSLKDQHSRATLRVDAFLGEWLSPDYFEMITPPPNSTLMVAAAKADLLRRADAIDTYTPTSPKVSSNLWGSNQNARHHAASVSVANPSPLSHETDGPLENWRVLSRGVPRRDRGNSLGSNKSPEQFRPPIGQSTSSRYDGTTGYAPPTPTYAISPGDAIPRGYVAHARDQCVNIDYQWDSMREPQLWGNGGQFGEEWSQMHKRFRHGLNSMIEWYGVNDCSQKPAHDEHEAVPEAQLDSSDDDDEDLVVVLVTHGAGCNALIGALTNQPVLLDVGMASLTMAVRKNDASPSGSEHRSPVDSPAAGNSPALGPTDSLGRPVPRRRSSLDLGLSSIYDIKLVASSDHLRPGVDPTRASTPVAASPVLSASQTVPQSRSRRFGSAGSHTSAGAPVDSNWNLPEPRTRVNSSLGSARRPSRPVIIPIVSSPVLGAASDSPTGLWMPGSAKASDSPSFTNPLANSLARANSATARLAKPRPAIPERSVSPKNADTKAGAETGEAAATDSETSAILEEAKSTASELPSVGDKIPAKLGRSLSQKGLWGSAPSGSFPRETGIPKRRWTVVQQDS